MKFDSSLLIVDEKNREDLTEHFIWSHVIQFLSIDPILAVLFTKMAKQVCDNVHILK